MMGSSLPCVVLGVGLAVVMRPLTGSEIAAAQPASGSSARADASTRANAKKLVEDGIAAQAAKDYDRAISLYLRAFSLDPHPLLLFNVAQALRLAGCTERAVAFYERYLKLEPSGTESATAREFLAELRSARPAKAQAGSAAAGRASCGAADALMGSSPAPAANPTGRLRLHSNPDGVTVMLDGVKVGATPLERELPAGAHMIALVEGERLVGERKVEIDADAVAEVTIPVQHRPDDVSHRRSHLAPALLWVGGGLALAGSGVALYLGQQGGPDHPEDFYRYPGATATGFVLAGVGAASIGAGIWLWVRGSRESAPVAAISSSGGYLGWQGRF
jgi:hypothetical protein